MVPYKGFLSIPETTTDFCIGCGACEHVCPVTDPHPAIYVIPDKEHRLARKPGKEKKIEINSSTDFPF
jgi:formate hydrogenlyase subunit 6/NADH:ubiquinone oxidoreductase subunit I